MNKALPCYIISDLLPLYQDDILSEQTKKDIDKHLNECEDCKKMMEAMKMQIDVKTTNTELKINPLKKGEVLSENADCFGGSYSFYFGSMLSSCGWVCCSRTWRGSHLSN